jgi:penicillin-binding protein 1A
MAFSFNFNQEHELAYFKKRFWKIFFYFLGGLTLFFLFASWGLFGSMPSFEDLENPDSNLATEIIAADGATIGKFYNENRTPIKYADLPKHLVNALIATEDERFFEHSGIDGRGTLRAVLSVGTSGGASTLTQQLARNTFTEELPSKDRSITKLRPPTFDVSQNCFVPMIAVHINKI